jgi:glycosyltransferase involved in cell wall biosynthesis
MRILVYPASMDLGGSQLNAIELAARAQQQGHHVVVFGPDGPLRSVLEESGLAFIQAPRPRWRPSPAVMKALGAVVREQRIDIVHGYEWPPILECCYGPFLRNGVAAVGTVMSMGVAPFIPPYLPLIVGTAQIADAERPARPDIEVLEPPVDTDLNRPSKDNSAARAELGAGPQDFLVTIVSRLANELKREGIVSAIRAVALLAPELPIRLAICGDGPSRAEIEAEARAANERTGRIVVTLLGEVFDPRPVYAAADVSIGMGSSALRAMAFGTPLIVQGERGFFRLLTPDSLPMFLQQGWYGIGDSADGVPALVPILRGLHNDPVQRGMLGGFARDTVVERFSLSRAADLQEDIYTRALAGLPRRRSIATAIPGPAARAIRYEFRRRYARYRGRAAMDDFNAISAQPVAPATAPS